MYVEEANEGERERTKKVVCLKPFSLSHSLSLPFSSSVPLKVWLSFASKNTKKKKAGFDYTNNNKQTTTAAAAGATTMGKMVLSKRQKL